MSTSKDRPLEEKTSSITERIEKFFSLSSLVCNCCGKIDPQAFSLGIHTKKDWERRMGEEMEWIQAHKAEVILNLAPLRKSWSACCSSLEEVLH